MRTRKQAYRQRRLIRHMARNARKIAREQANAWTDDPRVLQGTGNSVGEMPS